MDPNPSMVKSYNSITGVGHMLGSTNSIQIRGGVKFERYAGKMRPFEPGWHSLLQLVCVGPPISWFDNGSLFLEAH